MAYMTKLKPQQLNVLKGKRLILPHIDIELTERCNNNCVHCCINLPEGDDGARCSEMSTDLVKKILTDAAALGCFTARFTGGEPLLYKDFAELYLFTRRLGMEVVLFTNARLVTPELAELFARIPPRRLVEVSVYGMSSGTYDRVAGKEGVFEEFCRGIDLLLHHRVAFIVKAPLLRFLKDEQAEFEVWAKKIPSMVRAPRYSINFDLRSRRDDHAKNISIARLRATPEETVEKLSHSASYLKQMGEFCSRFIGPPGDKLFSCGAGLGICVDAYGKAQMCLSLREASTVVDLRAVSLRSVLEDSFPVMREVRATNPDYLRRCARCFIKGLCEQCPAKSWMEHGTLDTPVDYFCEVAHAQARYLGLLGEYEHAWEVDEWRKRVERMNNLTVA